MPFPTYAVVLDRVLVRTAARWLFGQRRRPVHRMRMLAVGSSAARDDVVWGRVRL